MKVERFRETTVQVPGMNTYVLAARANPARTYLAFGVPTITGGNVLISTNPSTAIANAHVLFNSASGSMPRWELTKDCGILVQAEWWITMTGIVGATQAAVVWETISEETGSGPLGRSPYLLANASPIDAAVDNGTRLADAVARMDRLLTTMKGR